MQKVNHFVVIQWKVQSIVYGGAILGLPRFQYMYMYHTTSLFVLLGSERIIMLVGENLLKVIRSYVCI